MLLVDLAQEGYRVPPYPKIDGQLELSVAALRWEARFAPVRIVV